MYEMENYVPRKLIEDEFKCDLSEYDQAGQNLTSLNT